MRTTPSIPKQAWFRFIAFIAVIGLALVANRWRQPDPARPVPPLPATFFPDSAGGFRLVALEPPSALTQRELRASYRATSSPQAAYASLGYGVQSFHNWIGCFLVEGPQPLWSGSLQIVTPHGTARFEAAVLRQAGQARAVAHSECWRGGWRGSEWQNRWFALWRRPGEQIPVLNAYIVTDAGGTQPSALRLQLTAFLSGLDWQQLNATCGAAR